MTPSSVCRRCAAIASLGIAAAVAHASPGGQTVSADVRTVVRGVLSTHDHQGQPFAVIDKKNARAYVYDAEGRLQASSPVLLGLARGDTSVPGIGERAMSKIQPQERTTPAGRFVSEPGRNTSGEDIVWVDYDAAVSMHRVRASRKADRRLERLATPTVADNRISYGCINVPSAFYDAYVKPALGQRHGVVYVLPDSSSLRAHFSFLTPG